MPFLDVAVTKCDTYFSTDLYRKPTFTGLLTKFDSSVSAVYKTNLIDCLIQRAYNICSDRLNFNNELRKLRTFFNQNNFPQNFVDKRIAHKLNSLFSPRTPTMDVPRKLVYVKLPFVSHESNRNTRFEVGKLVREFYPQLKVVLIFQNFFTVGSFFSVQG